MFRSRVLTIVRRIPAGRIATYGDIAAAAGNARACRAVGNIMRDCKASGVPCHRVVAAGGRLGGYGGNLELKRGLLRAEGILVTGERIRNFSERRWTEPASPKRSGGPASPKRSVGLAPAKRSVGLAPPKRSEGGATRRGPRAV